MASAKLLTGIGITGIGLLVFAVACTSPTTKSTTKIARVPFVPLLDPDQWLRIDWSTANFWTLLQMCEQASIEVNATNRDIPSWGVGAATGPPARHPVLFNRDVSQS